MSGRSKITNMTKMYDIYITNVCQTLAVEKAGNVLSRWLIVFMNVTPMQTILKEAKTFVITSSGQNCNDIARSITRR